MMQLIRRLAYNQCVFALSGSGRKHVCCCLRGLRRGRVAEGDSRKLMGQHGGRWQSS